jgi:hypothetical protein
MEGAHNRKPIGNTILKPARDIFAVQSANGHGSPVPNDMIISGKRRPSLPFLGLRSWAEVKPRTDLGKRLRKRVRRNCRITDLAAQTVVLLCFEYPASFLKNGCKRVLPEFCAGQCLNRFMQTPTDVTFGGGDRL